MKLSVGQSCYQVAENFTLAAGPEVMIRSCDPAGGRHDLLPPAVTVSFVVATVSASRAAAGSVVQAGQMLEARSGHTAALLPDGRVLIVGDMRRNKDFYKSAEIYDPATGNFQRTGEMSIGRVGQIAVLLRAGRVLIAGAWVGHGGTDSAELYDPVTGKFTVIAKMNSRRGRPSATLLANGNVLVAGGEREDNESLASAEIFDMKTLSF